MLDDIERKTLRIIANYSAGRNRMPTIDELCTKTGRSRSGMIGVLEKLKDDLYIEWNRKYPGEITLLEAWERKARH